MLPSSWSSNYTVRGAQCAKDKWHIVRHGLDPFVVALLSHLKGIRLWQILQASPAYCTWRSVPAAIMHKYAAPCKAGIAVNS